MLSAVGRVAPTIINNNFIVMFNRRPQSAKLAHGYRSTGGTSAGGKSTFNFRKK